MLLVIFAFLFVDHDISEVGGEHLISATTTKDRTLVCFRQDFMDFDVYSFDWLKYKETGAKTFTKFPGDGRIRFLGFVDVLATSRVTAIASIGIDKIFIVSKTGEFQEQRNLREIYEQGEKTFKAYVDKDIIYLVTAHEDHMYLSTYDIHKHERTVVYRVDKAGPYHLVKHGQALFKIRHATGELTELDEALSPVYHLPPAFEKKEKSGLPEIGKKWDFQGLAYPMVLEGGSLTLTYTTRQKGKTLNASARFNGKTFVYSRYRVIGKSPDGNTLLIFDYEDDEFKIEPASFELPESLVPPLPEN